MPFHQMTTPDPAFAEERALRARFLAAVPANANADAHLVWRGRTLDTDCLIQIGASPVVLRIRGGSVRECLTEIPLLCSWQFAVRGSPRAWAELWKDPPAPGWHDLFALCKRGELSIEGNLQPFMAHLQYFKDLLSLPRGADA
jgi:hypothetical protein